MDSEGVDLGRDDLEPDGARDGTEMVHEQEPRPGSRVPLYLTVVLVALALLVPILWAIGIFRRISQLDGIGSGVGAVYFTVLVLIIASAIFYFWKQFHESA